MRKVTSFRIVLMLILIITLTNCQAPKTSPLRDRIKNEAEKMCNSLVNKNYEGFVTYMYPPLIELMGGKEKVIDILRKGLPEGSTIERVKISYPSDTIMINNQIQCTLKEVIEMNVKGGKLLSTSTLIGISDDHGKIWYFLDANSKSLVTLKRNFPDLSGRLILEESLKPIYTKE